MNWPPIGQYDIVESREGLPSRGFRLRARADQPRPQQCRAGCVACGEIARPDRDRLLAGKGKKRRHEGVASRDRQGCEMHQRHRREVDRAGREGDGKPGAARQPVEAREIGNIHAIGASPDLLYDRHPHRQKTGQAKGDSAFDPAARETRVARGDEKQEQSGRQAMIDRRAGQQPARHDQECRGYQPQGEAEPSLKAEPSPRSEPQK